MPAKAQCNDHQNKLNVEHKWNNSSSGNRIQYIQGIESPVGRVYES